MDLINTIIIAIALAMDSFTVAISGGASLKKYSFKSSALVAAYFGFFQFIMFLSGYIGGDRLRIYIDSYDHWIALLLLIFIGNKMIIGYFDESEEIVFSLKHKILLILALATSIDALGIGLSYSLLNKPLLLPSILIGIAAFIFSIIGMSLGKFIKRILKNRSELFGGIILILIGYNIAIQHNAFGFL